MADRKIIELEEGWERMQLGINKLKGILEGSTEQKFVSDEYINLYTYALVRRGSGAGLRICSEGNFDGNGELGLTFATANRF